VVFGISRSTYFEQVAKIQHESKDVELEKKKNISGGRRSFTVINFNANSCGVMYDLDKMWPKSII
jgi:hypothetical protein